MSKRLLAVFDNDLGYVERFLKYIKRKRHLPFSAVGFSSLTSFRIFLERTPVDILLLSEELADESLLNELHENPAISEILISGEKQDSDARQKYINKYRAADLVISDIISFCRLDMFGEEETPEDPDSRILGVYSPTGEAPCQLFAEALAGNLSQNHSVLYVELERFSGMMQKKAEHSENTMSDLIYFFQTNPRKMREALSKTVFPNGGYDVLLAPEDMEDMDIMEEKRWRDFFRILIECGSYDVIVLHMAEAFRKPELIFGFCEMIAVPFVRGRRSNEQVAEFKEYLLRKEGERMLDKLAEIELDGRPDQTGGKTVDEDAAFLFIPDSYLQEKAAEICYRYERQRHEY